MRDALRQALQKLARLLEIPRPQDSIETAKAEAQSLIGDSAKSFDQARRYAELTQFEFEESPDGDRTWVDNIESTLSHAERLVVTATSLVSNHALNEWQQLPPAAKIAESELRNIAANRVERAATSDTAKGIDDADLSIAFARWNEMMLRLSQESRRTALISQIAAEVQHLE